MSEDSIFNASDSSLELQPAPPFGHRVPKRFLKDVPRRLEAWVIGYTSPRNHDEF